MKIKTDGRLPLNTPKDLGFALATLFREIGQAVNELIDIVMASAKHSTSITGDTLVFTGRTKYRGIVVNAATAGGAIDIRDAVSAGTGTIIESIPAAKAVGRYETNLGWQCETGLYVDYAGGATGTIVVLYE